MPFPRWNTNMTIQLTVYTMHTLKLQPHEGDNLDERIVTIPGKRVYGATQARPCVDELLFAAKVYSESVL